MRKMARQSHSNLISHAVRAYFSAPTLPLQPIKTYLRAAIRDTIYPTHLPAIVRTTNWYNFMISIPYN
jgi:hypothetical protein